MNIFEKFYFDFLKGKNEIFDIFFDFFDVSDDSEHLKKIEFFFEIFKVFFWVGGHQWAIFFLDFWPFQAILNRF